MRYLLVLTMAAALFGQSKPAAKKAAPAPVAKKAAARKAPAAPAPAASATEIPKGATEIRPGLFQHKDAKGEVWHYSRTPFGVQKFKPEAPKEPSAEEADALTAFDEGDTVRFERKTPFGVSKYAKKKAELSAAERTALGRAPGGRTAAPVAAKSAK